MDWNRYAYARYNPINFNDPTGHWVDAVVDGIFIGADIYDIQQNGLNWENGLALTADLVGAAIPVATGLGLGVRALFKASKAVDTVADTARVLDKAADASKIIDGVSEAIPAGAKLIGAGDNLAKAASWIKPETGFFDVVVHGSEDAFHVLHNGKWVEVDHRTLATFIEKNGWNGEQIRLISCGSGGSPTGVAKGLANKLGVKVKAPDDTIWIHPNGNLTIGPSSTVNSGSWVDFVPGAK